MHQDDLPKPPKRVDPSDTVDSHNQLLPAELNTIIQAEPANEYVQPVQLAIFSPSNHTGDIGRLGRYRVLKELGRGGMGAVYLGHDESLQRQVALKVLLPEVAANPTARERFLREARTVAKVHSDHVVTIHDVGEENGVPFLAMEYLQGYSLDHYLRQKGNLSIDHVIRVGHETALGLAAAHQMGLVHRDIKPGNLWLEAPKGRVKILDFGLAREQETDAQITNSGAIIGTPAYMSPEQADGQRVDSRSDLFSLGSVLYRLATGRLPFPGNSTLAIIKSLAVKEPIPVQTHNPNVPQPLAQLIHRLLAKNVDERYQTAAEVVDALEKISRHGEQKKALVVKVEPLSISIQTENIWGGLEDQSTAEKQYPIASEQPSTGKSFLPLWLIISVLGGISAFFFTLIIFLMKSPTGTLVIESDDDRAEVVIRQYGGIVNAKTKSREIALNVGEYTIELAENFQGLIINTDSVAIKRNERSTVRIQLDQQKNHSKPTDQFKNVPQLPTAKIQTEPEVYRELAEWVLKHPGKNSVVYGSPITSVDKLPKNPMVFGQVVFSKLPNPRQFDPTPLKHLWQLEQFMMYDSAFDDQDFDRILPILKEMNLESIGFVNCAISDVTIRKLDQIPSVSRVLIDKNLKLTSQVYSDLANSKSISAVDVGQDLSDQDAKILLSSKKWKKVNLISSKLTSSIIPLLLQNRQLTMVQFESVPLTDHDLTRLADLSELALLYLRNSKATPEGIRQVAEKLPKCKVRLDSIDIERPIPNAPAERRVAERLKPHFDSLKLRLTNAQLIDVRKDEPLPKSEFAVVELNLPLNDRPKDFVSSVLLPALFEAEWIESFYDAFGKTIWSDKDIERLGTLPICKRLQSFHAIKVLINDKIFGLLRACPQLKELAVGGGQITDDQIIALSQFAQLKKLNFDNLNGMNKLTAKGWESFSKLPLTFLNLQTPKNWTQIHSEYLSKMDCLSNLRILGQIESSNFVPLQHSKSIRHITVWAKDSGCIRHLGKMELIQNITLWDGGPIKDEDLVHLEGLKYLRSLSLSNTLVTEAGVKKLAQKLPRCRIHWDGGIVHHAWPEKPQ